MKGATHMPQYLIVCRSLTYAQRAVKVLERVGISSTLTRAPAELTGTGCGYCVKLSGKRLGDALKVFRLNGFSPVKILLIQDDGAYREVRSLDD